MGRKISPYGRHPLHTRKRLKMFRTEIYLTNNLVVNTRRQAKMSKTDLIPNVHEGAKNSEYYSKASLVSGYYEYYHYLCDAIDDRGWGCGYRTLQTICSWIKYESNLGNGRVPSIRKIQQTLIEMEDKPESFMGSSRWIGSFEVCLVLDYLYEIPCKILHVNTGNELNTIVETLKAHFDNYGSPVMMGGDVDCSSKGIMGIHGEGDDARLLIVDPHFVGPNKSKEFLYNEGWVKWQPLTEFLSSSFYNLCLPQVKAKNKTPA